VSPISITTSPFSTRVVTRSVPEPHIASTALLIKFVYTWFSSPAYASIMGTVPRTTVTPQSRCPRITSVLSRRGDVRIPPREGALFKRPHTTTKDAARGNWTAVVCMGDVACSVLASRV
jgi:hypothetical protein